MNISDLSHLFNRHTFRSEIYLFKMIQNLGTALAGFYGLFIFGWFIVYVVVSKDLVDITNACDGNTVDVVIAWISFWFLLPFGITRGFMILFSCGAFCCRE